ncbi:MAG: hypothetical protein JXQ90_05605 [Cyclobacteriaceae bacterium]
MWKLLKVVSLFLLLACGVSEQKKDSETNGSDKVAIDIKPSLSLIDGPSDALSSLPYLTKRADKLLMSWIEKSEDTAKFYFSEYDGGNWSEKSLIASGSDWFVNWADYPMISAGDHGMMAHYLQKSAPDKFAYDVTVLLNFDDSWNDPFVVHQDGIQAEHGFVTTLVNDDNYQMAWLDGRHSAGGHDHGGGSMTLRTASVNAKTGIISEEMELDDKTCDCCQTTGAMTATGPVFVYRDRSDLEIRDISIVRLVDGNWTAPKVIYQDNWKIAGCPVNGPRMDAFDDQLAIAWFSSPNNKSQVKVIFSNDAGETFFEPILIDESQPVGRVDLAMITKDKAIVSWLDMQTDEAVIKAQLVTPNGKLGDEIIVARTSESRGSGFPQLEIVRGDVYLSWTAIEENNTKVKVAVLSELQ